MTNRSSMAACVVLLVLGACAKSETPLPNKNTNWLDRCKVDADCGDELECRCGMCTMTCQSDSACELDEQQALCWQEQSDELAAQCGERASARAICVPEALTVVAQPMDEPCAKPGSCEITIAEGLQLPKALAVDDERVYWLEAFTSEEEGSLYSYDGTLESARHDGTGRIAHVTDIRPRESLNVDGSHIYFMHDAVRSGGPFLSRIPLGGGGEVQRIYEGEDINGIVLSAPTAYFLGLAHYIDGYRSNHAIKAIPVDGSLYTTPFAIPNEAEVVVEIVREDYGGPSSLIEGDGSFYWKARRAIYRLDAALDGAPVVLVPPNDVPFPMYVGALAHGDGCLVWMWVERREDENPAATGIGTVDLTNPAAVRSVEVPDLRYWSGLAVDATHIYAAQSQPNGDATIVRIDLATLQVTSLRTLEYAGEVRIALSDDHVFVAWGNYDPPASGTIIRFAKGVR